MHGMASSVFHDGQGIFQSIAHPFNAGRYHSLIVNLPSQSALIATATSEERKLWPYSIEVILCLAYNFIPESILTENGFQIIKNFCDGLYDLVNGQFYRSPYQISVFDKLNLGMTTFTTMLAQNNQSGQVVLHHGSAHYARLVRHSSVLGLKLPYSEDALLTVAEKLIKVIKGEFFALRIQVTGGEGARGISVPEESDGIYDCITC